MSRSTRFECPNCGERRPVVASDGTTSAKLNCPNCEEPIVVAFGED